MLANYFSPLTLWPKHSRQELLVWFHIYTANPVTSCFSQQMTVVWGKKYYCLWTPMCHPCMHVWKLWHRQVPVCIQINDVQPLLEQMALPLKNQVHSFDVLNFYLLWLIHQLQPYLDVDILANGNLQFRLLQCVVHGTAFENSVEIALGPKLLARFNWGGPSKLNMPVKLHRFPSQSIF